MGCKPVICDMNFSDSKENVFEQVSGLIQLLGFYNPIQHYLILNRSIQCRDEFISQNNELVISIMQP